MNTPAVACLSCSGGSRASAAHHQEVCVSQLLITRWFACLSFTGPFLISSHSASLSFLGLFSVSLPSLQQCTPPQHAWSSTGYVLPNSVLQHDNHHSLPGADLGFSEGGVSGCNVNNSWVELSQLYSTHHK